MTTLGRITFILLITGCAGGSPVTPAQQPAWPELRPHALPASGTVFVANSNAIGVSKEIEIYEPPYTAAPKTIVANVGLPVELAVAPNGTLFETGFSGTVIAMRPPYTTPHLVLRGGRAIAVDRQSDLIVAGFNNGLRLFAPPYERGSALFAKDFLAVGLFVDSHDNLFASGEVPHAKNGHTPAVREFKPPYTGPPIVTITNGLYFPMAGIPYMCAEDSSGDLFVTNGGGIHVSSPIVEYAPPYTGAPKAVISSHVSWADNALIGANNALIFLNCGFAECGFAGVNNVRVLASPYTGHSQRVPVRNPSNPDGIALGRGMQLFARNARGVSIFSPPYNGPASTTITKGVHGDGPIAVYAPP